MKWLSSSTGLSSLEDTQETWSSWFSWTSQSINHGILLGCIVEFGNQRYNVLVVPLLPGSWFQKLSVPGRTESILFCRLLKSTWNCWNRLSGDLEWGRCQHHADNIQLRFLLFITLRWVTELSEESAMGGRWRDIQSYSYTSPAISACATAQPSSLFALGTRVASNPATLRYCFRLKCFTAKVH